MKKYNIFQNNITLLWCQMIVQNFATIFASHIRSLNRVLLYHELIYRAITEENIIGVLKEIIDKTEKNKFSLGKGETHCAGHEMC